MQNAVEQKIAQFFLKHKEVVYKKKETIHFVGDIASNIVYVTSGYVRTFISSEEGQEFTVRLYKPTNLLFFVPVYTDTPIMHTYATISEVHGRSVSREQFMDFLKANPDVHFELTNIYLVSLNTSMKRLERIIIGNATERIIIILNLLTNSLGGMIDDDIKGDIQVPVTFTHNDLAAFAGLTRETVTLELDKLKDQGIISFSKKNIKILDKEKIKKIFDKALLS